MWRFLSFFALSLTLTTQLCFGQVSINPNGNMALGSTVPSSTQRVRIIPGSTTANFIGLYVSSPSPGAARFGIQAFSGGGTITSHGIWAQGSFGNNNVFGVRGEARNGAIGYGIYGYATGSTNNNYAGYFSGDVLVTGTIFNPSDARLKERAAPLDPAEVLSRLTQLTAQSYYYRTSPEYAPMSLPATRQYGLIAQEVALVFPDLVSDQVQPPPLDDQGQEVGESITYKSVDYMKLIPLLLAAVQEQQRRIEALEAALQK